MTGVPLRVLMLEDQPDDAELLVLELEQAGFEVEWTRVDDEAGFVAAVHAGLDVILADFTLPTYDVLRALDTLGRRGLTVPFIVVSGTISEQVAVDALKRGAADYLAKDRIARLPAAVNAAVDQRRLRDARDCAAAQLADQAQQLARANAELQRADELKNQLLLTTAHEMRSPLASIGGFAELLLEPTAGSVQERETWAAIIAGQARHLLCLVEDLLTFSAATLGSLRLALEPVRVAEALGRAVATSAPDAVIDCPADAVVRADPGRLQQIVVNLLTNAVKYGGAHIRVDVRTHSGAVEIRISDDGPGVDEDFVPLLFDTFSRSRADTAPADGFGLGLAIARSLAAAHGGLFRYEPNVPSGACFVLRLPDAHLPGRVPTPRSDAQREGATP